MQQQPNWITTTSMAMDCPYTTESVPYSDRPARMTDGALKRVFAHVLDSRERRIQRVQDYLWQNLGIVIAPTSTDEMLDTLPNCLARLGTLVPCSSGDNDSSITGLRNAWFDRIPTGRASMSEADDQTLHLVFDAAMLWGEAFRFRYPGANWILARKPKNTINYGDPVLVGAPDNFSEFSPCRELRVIVWTLLRGANESRALSELMKIRAHNLGLGPDPSIFAV